MALELKIQNSGFRTWYLELDSQTRHLRLEQWKQAITWFHCHTSFTFVVCPHSASSNAAVRLQELSVWVLFGFPGEERWASLPTTDKSVAYSTIRTSQDFNGQSAWISYAFSAPHLQVITLPVVYEKIYHSIVQRMHIARKATLEYHWVKDTRSSKLATRLRILLLSSSGSSLHFLPIAVTCTRADSTSCKMHTDFVYKWHLAGFSTRSSSCSAAASWSGQPDDSRCLS